MIKELLLVIVGAALANNLVLSGFFGFDSVVLGEKKSYALSTAIVLLVSAVVCSLLHGVLESAGLEYMEIMVYAIIVLLASCLPGLFLKDKAPSYALLVLNSAVLGMLLVNHKLGLAESACFAVGTAVGFWVLLEIFDSLTLKLNNPNVPKAMRGMPITVLAAGIISMAIYAF